MPDNVYALQFLRACGTYTEACHGVLPGALPRVLPVGTSLPCSGTNH